MKYLLVIFIPLLMLNAQDNDMNSEMFSLSLSVRYSTAQIDHGIEISGDRGIFSTGISIEHSSGLSCSYVNTRFSAAGTLNHSFGAGYSYDITDDLSADIDLSRAVYTDQTVNAVAEFSTSLTASLNADLRLFDLSVSYEQYFGSGAPAYFGAGAMKIIRINDWALIPMMDLSFISQTIDYSTAKFKSNSGNSKKTGQLIQSTVSLSGISGVIVGCVVRYDLGKGFTCRFTPHGMLTPKQEIASRSVQWTASVGLSYDTGF